MSTIRAPSAVAMSTFRESSAMAATFLSVSITSILTGINSFGGVVPEGPFGISLILLSCSTLLTGGTPLFSGRSSLNSLLLLLTTVWMSLGSTKLWTAIKRRNGGEVPDNNKHLLPGYVACLSVVLVFLFLSLCNKKFKALSLLSAVCIVLFIFEIVGIWKTWFLIGPVLIVLILILSFYWLSNSLAGICWQNKVDSIDSVTQNFQSSESELLLYATSSVSYSAFGWQVTTLSKDTQFAFSWPLSAGICQLALGVFFLRRYDAVKGVHSLLFGILWIAFGTNLWLEDYLSESLFLPVPVCVIVFTLLLLLFVLNFRLEVFRSFSYLILCLMVLSLTLFGDKDIFSGIVGILGFVSSLYGVAAHLTRLLEFRFLLPLGQNVFETGLYSRVRCCDSKIRPSDQASTVFPSDMMLGFSKYVDVQCLSFLLNAVATIVIIPESSEHSIHALPFCLGFGGVLQTVVGYIAFSRGLTFESCCNFVFASFWSIWGTSRILDLSNSGISTQSGCISFLFISLVLGGLSTTINVLWFCTSISFTLVVISFLVSGLVDSSSVRLFHVVVTSIFAVVQIYGFLSTFITNMLGQEILPTGKPFITFSHLRSSVDKIVLSDARKASGVRQIAELLNSGKICGVPSDTVYVLVAACNQPAAVERAYKCKNSAEDRPMSIWISSLDQIKTAKKEIGTILWEFLQELWPSNISVVLNRGAWVGSLGLGDSCKYVGKPDSVAIRIPDCSIICHLIDQTGPIVVTSANPTGEADTTHHWQVLAKLGNKNCDGVLCDGPSPENAASTVVDCRKASEGKLTFFRIGLSPKSKVEEILDKVLQKHKPTSDNASDSGVSTKSRQSEDKDQSSKM